MAIPKGRSWRLERAGVNRRGADRSRSNKFSKSDSKPAPPARTRGRVWVGGYRKADGTKVAGYYRSTPG
jgi:hypothetical protein